VNLATETAPLEASEVDELMDACPLYWALYRRQVVVPVQPPAVTFGSIKKLGKLLRGRC